MGFTVIRNSQSSLQNKSNNFEYPLGAALALKTQNKPILLPINSVPLGLCIFLIYLLTFFHWMRLCLIYLVYLHFYMKVRLWIYFSYLICFMHLFVHSHIFNKKKSLLLHSLFVSPYSQSALCIVSAPSPPHKQL